LDFDCLPEAALMEADLLQEEDGFALQHSAAVDDARRKQDDRMALAK